MPAQIDWKAEDEQTWEGFEPEITPAPRGRGPGRRLRLIGLALLLVAIVAAAILSQANRFLDRSIGVVEDELLAGHELVMEAARNGDGELLRGLIFDRLQEWTDAQVQLAEQGLWLDRTPLELYLVDSDGPLPTEVTLEPSLRRAMVAVTATYRLGPDVGGSDTVRLEQIFPYRFEDERWLLNPLTGADWGERITTSGRYLTLGYPERDADIGQRLAADLEAVIGQTCNSVELTSCEDDIHLSVDLVVDPRILVEMSDPSWPLTGGQSIKLPTPTLLGRPQDEAAYRALYRAYASSVVSRLLGEQTNLSERRLPLLDPGGG